MFIFSYLKNSYKSKKSKATSPTAEKDPKRSNSCRPSLASTTTTETYVEGPKSKSVKLPAEMKKLQEKMNKDEKVSISALVDAIKLQRSLAKQVQARNERIARMNMSKAN